MHASLSARADPPRDSHGCVPRYQQTRWQALCCPTLDFFPKEQNHHRSLFSKARKQMSTWKNTIDRVLAPGNLGDYETDDPSGAPILGTAQRC